MNSIFNEAWQLERNGGRWADRIKIYLKLIALPLSAVFVIITILASVGAIDIRFAVVQGPAAFFLALALSLCTPTLMVLLIGTIAHFHSVKQKE